MSELNLEDKLRYKLHCLEDVLFQIVPFCYTDKIKLEYVMVKMGVLNLYKHEPIEAYETVYKICDGYMDEWNLE